MRFCSCEAKQITKRATRDNTKMVSQGSLTPWTAAPRIDKRREREEKRSMSFKEMEAAIADIHGQTKVDNVSDSASDAEIAAFDEAVDTLSDESKEALHKAQKECPEFVGKSEKSRFILTNQSKDPKVRDRQRYVLLL